MPLRLSIELTPADAPIIERTTKFGGQPVWVEQPQWPVSPRLQKPMRFVAQIELDQRIFGQTLGERIAYFFVTDDVGDDGVYVCGGWPGDGESAVVVQPSCGTIAATIPLTVGPTLRAHNDDELEFAVNLREANDPTFAADSEIYGWNNLDDPNAAWSDERRETYHDAIRGTKIGGTPNFFQGDQVPDDMVLLLQIESEALGLNLGDAGSGFLFISPDGKESSYIVQSC